MIAGTALLNTIGVLLLILFPVFVVGSIYLFSNSRDCLGTGEFRRVTVTPYIESWEYENRLESNFHKETLIVQELTKCGAWVTAEGQDVK